MTEVLHANIFFIIASVATVIFCLLVAIALYQLIRILRTVGRIVDRVEEGSKRLEADLTDLRDQVRSGGIIGRILGFFMSQSQATRRHKKSRDSDE